MKAIILSGGIGSRLGHLTTNCPKPLLKINNLTIIEWQIRALKKIGVGEILINTHYLADKITRYLRDGVHLGVKIKYIYQPKLNGTAGGVKVFEKDLSTENSFIVLYGDILINNNLSKLVLHHHYDAECSMYVHERKASNSLFLLEKNNGLVLDFLERPSIFEKKIFIQKHNIKTFWVNSAIYIMRPSIFKYIDVNKDTDIVKDIFPILLKNKSLFAVPIKGQRFSIDTIQKYEEAKSKFIC